MYSFALPQKEGSFARREVIRWEGLEAKNLALLECRGRQDNIWLSDRAYGGKHRKWKPMDGTIEFERVSSSHLPSKVKTMDKRLIFEGLFDSNAEGLNVCPPF